MAFVAVAAMLLLTARHRRPDLAIDQGTFRAGGLATIARGLVLVALVIRVVLDRDPFDLRRQPAVLVAPIEESTMTTTSS